MAYADIRPRLKTLLLSVPGVEIVHEYDRFAAEWGKFLDLFKDSSGRIAGWMISRKSVGGDRNHAPSIERTHAVRLRGFYGLNDAAGSEIVFQTLVDAVLDVIDADKTLGKAVQGCGPCTAEVIENRAFGKVLCHYAEIVVPVLEHVSLRR